MICVHSKLLNYQKITSFQAQMPHTSSMWRIYYLHATRFWRQNRGWFMLGYHSSHLEQVSLQKRWPGGHLGEVHILSRSTGETDHHTTVISITFICDSFCRPDMFGRLSVLFVIMLLTAQQRKFGQTCTNKNNRTLARR